MRVQLQIPTDPTSITIFAVPQTNEYQMVEHLNVIPAISKSQTVQDKIFGNKVAFFKGEDDRGSIEIDFSLRLIQRRMSISNSFTVSDYKPQRIKNIRHDDYINGRDKQIVSISQKIHGDEKNIGRIISSTYQYCLENLTYGKPIKGLYKYSQALKDSATDCGGFSTLIGSLLQAKDIPVRLVVGYVLKKSRKKALLDTFIKQKYSFKDFSMHAWLEAELPDGAWFPLDASVEWRRVHGVSEREGGYGFIPADRLITSFGHNIELMWEDKCHVVEILQDPATIMNS